VHELPGISHPPKELLWCAFKKHYKGGDGIETLDVRGLPHSERPPLILRKLEELGELELIVEVKPVPVITMLESRGYTCEAEHEGDFWRVRIRKR